MLYDKEEILLCINHIKLADPCTVFDGGWDHMFIELYIKFN